MKATKKACMFCVSNDHTSAQHVQESYPRYFHQLISKITLSKTCSPEIGKNILAWTKNDSPLVIGGK